jgi:Protein of unknown function (DUF1553)/Protein of unknown function (DUF1549)/Bacterial Ig-like domain (group 2)
MKRTLLSLAIPLWLSASGFAERPTALRIESTGTPALTLRGRDARQQLQVTADAARDFTRKATYRTEPAGIVTVSATGLVSPLGDGAATITAETEGVTAAVDVRVESFASDPAINFPNQIVPIFTKASCNGGGCHGKASGQNGFKLSLLGFEPAEDYEHIVKEARGRRVFPAAPDNSLLLLKATGIVPHGGGKRIEADSDDYRLLARWIAQGMPFGSENDPKVARIEVFPKQRTMTLGSEQQLVVLAHYTDGTALDVTRSALYEPNDKSMAKTEEDGRVILFDQPGDVGVMVRYQDKVAVFRATAPLGAPVENLPPARNYIDEIVFAKLKVLGMPASDPCDDATFLRRTGVDIAGRLPTLKETQKFLADADPAKRDKWIETLLASPEYADYFANKWGALLRNKRNDEKDARGSFSFHAWIRESLLTNKPYDQFVREIVAATGDVLENPPVAWYRQVKEPQQQLEDTAQLFLGTRLQCAQCHHHPFEKWSQQDYYSFSAFFSQVGRKAGDTLFHRRGAAAATNKKTRQPVKPAGLGTGPLDIAPENDPRLALADWMAKPENPLFARSLVNRYWKHFFNRGLVEPEDDLRETNPPCNPELLDALARRFVSSGYDLKSLVRDMVQSQTYQLSALPNEHNKSDRQNFSRYYPKRLTAEVLLDSINHLTGARSNFAGLPAGTRAVSLPDNSYNATSYFLRVFGRPDSASACECERTQEASLAQSLHLLNAKEIQDKLAANDGRAARLAEDAKRSEDEKLRELYAAAYSREPQSAELDYAKNYVAGKLAKETDDAKKPAARRQAYEDLVWALVSSKEFLFNH